MLLAVCRAFPELPWLSDRDQVTEGDRIGMVGACRACGVVEACAAFVITERITGGFWAGAFRDLPDLPDDTTSDASILEQPGEGQPVAS
jgi:hypothetical protein